MKYKILETSIPNFKNLTPLQQSFFHIMHATVNTGGCLLLSGDPGIGKTAIIRNMGKTLEYQYIDIRLSQKDESEVGLYPKVDNIDGVDCVKEIPPYWAVKANQRPTIIIFEELNRARREIQNAALQILMEREIGHDFKFNDDVYFIATSNMNDSHTEDFSTAMRGRLIHFEFEFDFDYWYDNYAKMNINSIVLEWISINRNLLTEELNDENDENELVSYLSPRSLSAFSKSLSYVLEHETDIENIITYTEEFGSKYIGNKCYSLLEFLRKWSQLSVEDVLNGVDDYTVYQLNREHILYLIDGLKTFIINNIKDGLFINDTNDESLITKDKHFNIIKFLSIHNKVKYDIIDQDIIVGFMNFIIEKCELTDLMKPERESHVEIFKLYAINFKEEFEIVEKSSVLQIL